MCIRDRVRRHEFDVAGLDPVGFVGRHQLHPPGRTPAVVPAAGRLGGGVVGEKAVSYTHLDVYKRQVWLLPRLPVEHRVGSPGLRSVVDGFVYLSRHPVLLTSFLVDLIAMIFGMPRALAPEVAHLSFGGPVDGGIEFAWLMAAIPIGAVAGGVFSGWVSKVIRQGRAVILCVLVWGAAIVGMGVAVAFAGRWQAAMLAAAVAFLIVGGAADMASAAFRQSMLQSAADDSVRGRLQGVFIVVVALSLIHI